MAAQEDILPSMECGYDDDGDTVEESNDGDEVATTDLIGEQSTARDNVTNSLDPVIIPNKKRCLLQRAVKQAMKGSELNPSQKALPKKRKRKVQPPQEVPSCIVDLVEEAEYIKQSVVEDKGYAGYAVPKGVKLPTTLEQLKFKRSQDYRCGLCEVTVNSMEKLLGHLKALHNFGRKGGTASRVPSENTADCTEPTTEEIKCGFCGHVERSTKALMLHFLFVHPASSTTIADDKRPKGVFSPVNFVCGLCGVQKDRDVELMDHYRVAHPVFPRTFSEEKISKDLNRRKQSVPKNKRAFVQVMTDTTLSPPDS